MYANKTLAPFIAIGLIVDFLIVKILDHVNVIESEDSVETLIEEHTNLLMQMQNAVAPNIIL